MAERTVSQSMAHRNVVSLGPAITYLGLNTVRSLCLHYMLEDSFQSADRGLRRYFDQVWGASSLASDLCLRHTVTG